MNPTRSKTIASAKSQRPVSAGCWCGLGGGRWRAVDVEPREVGVDLVDRRAAVADPVHRREHLVEAGKQPDRRRHDQTHHRRDVRGSRERDHEAEDHDPADHRALHVVLGEEPVVRRTEPVVGQLTALVSVFLGDRLDAVGRLEGLQPLEALLGRLVRHPGDLEHPLPGMHGARADDPRIEVRRDEEVDDRDERDQGVDDREHDDEHADGEDVLAQHEEAHQRTLVDVDARADNIAVQLAGVPLDLLEVGRVQVGIEQPRRDVGLRIGHDLGLRAGQDDAAQRAEDEEHDDGDAEPDLEGTDFVGSEEVPRDDNGLRLLRGRGLGQELEQGVEEAERDRVEQRLDDGADLQLQHATAIVRGQDAEELAQDLLHIDIRSIR